MSELHVEFVRYLSGLDRGALAVLRRSLGFDPPGSYVPAFRYVEPWVGGLDAARAHRDAMYLTAGLYALATRGEGAAALPADATAPTTQVEPDGNPDGTSGDATASRARERRRNLGTSLGRVYRRREASLTGSGRSLERRFTSLLDADETQLPHRLRQMVALVASEDDVHVDWSRLLEDLTHWNHERRLVQQRWARAFYCADPAANPGSKAETHGKDPE